VTTNRSARRGTSMRGASGAQSPVPGRHRLVADSALDAKIHTELEGTGPGAVLRLVGHQPRRVSGMEHVLIVGETVHQLRTVA
jgi:hypothetical protein